MSTENDYSFENIEFWSDVKKMIDVVDDYIEQNEHGEGNEANHEKEMVESPQPSDGSDSKRINLEKDVKHLSGSGKTYATKFSSPQRSLNNQTQYKSKTNKSRDYDSKRDDKKVKNKTKERRVDPGLQQKIQNLKEFKKKFKINKNYKSTAKFNRIESYSNRAKKDNFEEIKREFDDHSERFQKININNSNPKQKLDGIKLHNGQNVNQPKVYQYSELAKNTNLKASSSDEFSKAVPRVKNSFETKKQTYEKEKGSKLRNDFGKKHVSHEKVNGESSSYFKGDYGNISDKLKIHNMYHEEIDMNQGIKSDNKNNFNTEYYKNKFLNPDRSTRHNERLKTRRDSEYEHQSKNENKYDRRINNKYEKRGQNKYKGYREFSNNEESYGENKRIVQTKPQNSYRENIYHRKYDPPMNRRGRDSDFEEDKSISKDIKKKNACDESMDSKGYKNRNDSRLEGDYFNNKSRSQKMYKTKAPAFDGTHSKKHIEYKKQVKNERDYRSDESFNDYRTSNQNKHVTAFSRESKDRNKGYKKEIRDDFIDQRISNKNKNKKDSSAFYREYRDNNKGYKKEIKERSKSSSEDDYVDHRISNKKTEKTGFSAYDREYHDRNKVYKKKIRDRSVSSSEDDNFEHKISNKKVSSAFYKKYRDRNESFNKEIKERSISSSEDEFTDHKINKRKDNVSDYKSYSELEEQSKKKMGSWKGSNSNPQRAKIKKYKARMLRKRDSVSESEDHSLEHSDQSEENSESENGLRIVSRKEWGAPLSKWGIGPEMKTPVPNVFIMPTNKRTCYNKEDCAKEMLFLIGRHMKTQLCPDIKYNFVIGGDGRVYEGRGWTTRPGLPIEYQNLNKFSLFIGLAGKFTEDYFPRPMRDARDEIISYGIDHDYIAENYKLHSPVD